MSRLLSFIRSVAQFIEDSLARPREQLSAGQHRVRYAWELTVYCYRQLSRHRAEGMAAELTYRTIFSLIPVVVLGLVVFRVVGGLEDAQGKVENQLFSFFGVPDIPAEYLSPIETEETPGPTAGRGGTAAAAGDFITANSGTANSEATGELSLAGPSSGETQPGEPAGISAGESVTSTGNSPTGNLPTGNSPTGNLRGDRSPASDPPAGSSGELPKSTAEATVASAATKSQESDAYARASIRRSLGDLTQKVSKIDFASIGVIGLLLFIYAAVALADSVEHLSNRIFDAPRSRPIHLRVAIHWSIVTLGGGLLAMSLYMSSQVIDWFGAYSASSTGTLILRHVLSVGASWVLLFLLYALMPNTHVSVRAAGIGSFVSATMWEAAKFGFQVYVGAAVPYAAIYASLGLIPLFLFWVYITWLIVLFGLILTYTLQTLRGRRPHEDRESDSVRGNPDWMLPIMAEIASAFVRGTVITQQDVADRLGLSSRVVHAMTQRLAAAGWLRELVGVDNQPSGLTLARPAERIRVRDILALSHQTRPESEHPGWRILKNLQEAEVEAAGEMRLDELVSPPPQPAE